MDAAFDKICRQIIEVAPGLHSAGTFTARTFEAIAKATRKLQIRNSVETGSGASTLLFSHLSDHHTVFALDDGTGSVTNIRRSPLLRSDVVTFVEGPTQVTLPQHRFTEKLQVVVIDGPHGYPFPDLEYYYLYPHLETGALLILDDIHIPTVHNLFQFLRRDAMFHLEQVVQRTAFFRRTSAPAFDPFGDGWWQQKYNATPLLRYTWREQTRRLLPAPLQRRVARMKTRVSRGSSRAKVEILAPQSGATVTDVGLAEGTADIPRDSFLWVLARRKDFQGWWPQGIGSTEGGSLASVYHLWRTPRYRVRFRAGGSCRPTIDPPAVDRVGGASKRNRLVSSSSVAARWLCTGGSISNCEKGSLKVGSQF